MVWEHYETNGRCNTTYCRWRKYRNGTLNVNIVKWRTRNYWTSLINYVEASNRTWKIRIWYWGSCSLETIRSFKHIEINRRQDNVCRDSLPWFHYPLSSPRKCTCWKVPPLVIWWVIKWIWEPKWNRKIILSERTKFIWRLVKRCWIWGVLSRNI